jgi:hypothetical protein
MKDSKLRLKRVNCGKPNCFGCKTKNEMLKRKRPVRKTSTKNTTKRKRLSENIYMMFCMKEALSVLPVVRRWIERAELKQSQNLKLDLGLSEARLKLWSAAIDAIARLELDLKDVWKNLDGRMSSPDFEQIVQKLEHRYPPYEQLSNTQKRIDLFLRSQSQTLKSRSRSSKAKQPATTKK